MRRVITTFLAMAGWLSAAIAAEITVISGGAVEPGLKAAVAAFEKQTGHQVRVTFNTTPQMQQRLGKGDAFDLVIAPPGLIKELATAGKVAAEGAMLGKVGSGVAIRPGAPVPKIASAEDIRQTVLGAESIVFNRASTGMYIEALFRKLGIWAEVEARTVRYATGAEVMKHTLNGKGREVAFGPITEILLEKPHGLVFVGPLPAEVQNYTSYVAVPMVTGAQKDLSAEFAAFLAGPVGKPLFVAAGIE